MPRRTIWVIAAVTGIAALLSICPPARAGTYTISGTCGLWGAYNYRPDRIAVYPECYGLIARNVGGPFSTPAGAAGGWSFWAPPGTSVDSFSLQGSMGGLKGWQATGYLQGGGLNGFAFENCPGATCPGSDKYLLNTTYAGAGAGAVVLRVRCGSTKGCPNSGGVNGYFQLYASTFTLTDNTAPAVAITGGPLVGPGWRRGTAAVALNAVDNTGVRLVRAYLDGSPRAEAARGCDYSRKAPCTNGPSTLMVATGGVRDGRHTLSVQAIDTAGNGATASRTIATDNTAPTAPIQTLLASRGAWQTTNRFALTWHNPPQTASPIAAARMSLCPESNAPLDPQGCVGATRPGSRGAVTDLQVPRAGAWTPRFWLRDAAGNEDPDSAVTLPALRFDPTPPQVALREPDPADPRRIRVKASDATSGIARGEVELRRRGRNTWHSLATQLNPSGFSALVDDEALGDGVYDVRVRATDRAGNEASASSRPGGRPATVVLPLRIKTRLAVGKVRRSHRRSRVRRSLVRRPSIGFGQSARLHGRLTMPGGNPIPDADIDVWERIALPDSAWRRVARVRTSRTGRFTFKAVRGPSRLLRFRYAGTPTIRARTSVVDLRVRASSSLQVNRHRLVNGEDVMFHGRVRGRRTLPAGKLVELQVYTRRRWRTFAQPRANPRSGNWTYRYRFEAIRGTVSFRFRARLRAEAGFPYGLGTSRRVRVTVRGT